MTIFTLKPNSKKSRLIRHLRTQSYLIIFSKIKFLFLNFINHTLRVWFYRLSQIILHQLRPNQLVKRFVAKNKSTPKQIISPIPIQTFQINFANNFVTRHLGLFILAGIVFAANFISARGSKIITEEYYTDIALSESSAVSEEDLVALVSKIQKYTPQTVKAQKPTAIVQRIVLKNAIITDDSQFVASPAVIQTTYAQGNNAIQTATATQRAGITYYIVKGGDTLASIAQKFGISYITVKNANNLSGDTIQPGQKLTILPTDGIVHTVARGETLSEIVAAYKGNLQGTIKANNLGGSAAIFASQKLVIIGGTKPAPTRTKLASNRSGSGQVAGIVVRNQRGPNSFPFGWCTWYVASRRYVPWRGNAETWPYQASRYGYRTGYAPAVGAILATRESRWGHVAYVEAVHGGTITISEMNYVGWGRVNYRTVPTNYGIYIY